MIIWMVQYLPSDIRDVKQYIPSDNKEVKQYFPGDFILLPSHPSWQKVTA